MHSCVAGNHTTIANEMEGMLNLVKQLRTSAAKELFVSLTTGTWPSPFWLQHGDAVWRGHRDLGLSAVVVCASLPVDRGLVCVSDVAARACVPIAVCVPVDLLSFRFLHMLSPPMLLHCKQCSFCKKASGCFWIFVHVVC